MRRYAAVSFLSALLLFLVQPLMARTILPWFGGAAAVWTTCLLFYQTLLFVGYAYAHLGRRLGVRRQALLHVVLMAATLALLPITPSAAWRPTGPEQPTLHLLALLTATVGGPYLLLAGTTPLLHDWFGRTAPGRSPYWLYAVSNAGSLLALLAYPSVVEPGLAVHHQGLLWSWAYVGFAVAVAWVGWSTTDVGGAPAEPTDAGTAPTAADRLFWLTASACGSGLLLAVTNTVTMDVASIPLLWVVPLALYLLTFILAFSGRYHRGQWGAVLFLALGVTDLLWVGGWALAIVAQVALASGVLVAGCMVCHGELARSAPPPERLTGFYLTMAAGGAIGGALVAVVAPAVLRDYYELPAFVLLAFALLLVAVLREPGAASGSGTAVARTPGPVSRGLRTTTGITLAAVLAAAVIIFAGQTRMRWRGTVASARNFYGVLRVQDHPAGLMHALRVLRHGQIFHGAEFLDSARTGLPTTYFARGSGVALAITTHPKRVAGEPLRIGVIGLGVGTLAAWTRPGDTLHFYEIDPAAERLARRYFTYLGGSPGAVEVTLGDGRISLERAVEAAGGRPLYDILVVDAFAGDAVPVHLLTKECADLYGRAVGPDGLVLFQITNRYVDLGRVVRGLADAEGMQVVRVDQPADSARGALQNAWMLLAPRSFRIPPRLDAASTPLAGRKPPVLWTDDFSNLLGVLRAATPAPGS